MSKQLGRTATRPSRRAAKSVSHERDGIALPKRLQRQLEGVELTHPDRVVYPDQGLTKLDLAAYYVQVGERMLPYVVDRPLSLVRCPRGRAEPCFFQKHRAGKVPPSLASVPVREGQQLQYYFAVHNVAGLLALVQLGVLEIHLWARRPAIWSGPIALCSISTPVPGWAGSRLPRPPGSFAPCWMVFI